MSTKREYEPQERIALMQSYRKEGVMSCGGEEALSWYRKGISFAEISEEYDRKNYEYYYDLQKHSRSYERKGKRYFEKAAKCFRCSAELGNELAMMNYALYLYSFAGKPREAMSWFLKASDSGLAVADYELAAFYKYGCCGVSVDEEKAAYYFQRYQSRCAEDDRQFLLAWSLDEDCTILSRGYLFLWFCGESIPLVHDTPHAKPSAWKYE